MSQTAPIQVRYFFDPLCGWCYGAAPALKVLQAQPDVALTLQPVGLFADEAARPMDGGMAAYAWANDQRIQALTGQVFSPAYRDQVLGDATHLFDSGPASRALSAVQLTAPGRELDTLHALQHARYVDGLATSDTAVVAGLLDGLGLRAAAQALQAQEAGLVAHARERMQKARSAWQQLGLQGVPALQVQAAGGSRVLTGQVLYGAPDALLRLVLGR